jgi:hypothetical protein
MLLVFATTIWVFVALPVRAIAFDDGDFCKAFQQIAVDLNKRAGKMIDSMTRHDSMAVLCDSKVANFKKTLLVPTTQLREGWQYRMQQHWTQIYCADPIWSEAIRSGWTISTTLTTDDGARHYITAECR